MAYSTGKLMAFTARKKDGKSCLVIAENMDSAVRAVKQKYGKNTEVASISAMNDYGPNIGDEAPMQVIVASGDDDKEMK